MDKKLVIGVFALIAVLVLALIVWGLTLGEGGIIAATWNGMAGSVNDVWTAITGSDEGVIPLWRVGGTNIQDGIDDIDNGAGAGGTP